MARAMIKVDVRGRTALLDKLEQQHAERKSHGETRWWFNLNDDARHIGYVFLEWQSLRLMFKFLSSPESKRLISEWPCHEILEIVPLREVSEDLDA